MEPDDSELFVGVIEEHKIDVASELAAIERVLDRELIKRVSARYDNLFNRTLRNQVDRATKIMDEIASQHGFKDAKEFQQMMDAVLSIEFAKTVHEHPVDIANKERLSAIIKTVLTKWEGACTAIEMIHRGLTSELLQRALEIEETVWRAEKAGELDKLTKLVSSQDAIAKRFELERDHYIENGKDDEVMMWVEIDLDNFKTHNGELGHTVVDAKILQPLAERLQGVIRSTDSACRFGGDEFSLLLNCVQKSSKEMVINKIMAAIREPFILDGSQTVNVTASVGVLLIDKAHANSIDTVSTDQFMSQVRKQADIAAEFSKSKGKDQSTIYSTDLKDFQESQEVYVARFVREHLRELQKLRDMDKQEAADVAQKKFEHLAIDLYQARQTA